MNNEAVLKQFSSREQEMIDKLSAVVDIVGEIYQKQKHPQNPLGNLYPADITREEFDQAAIRDSSLKRFDTIVKRAGTTAQFKAVPYNVEYQADYARIQKLVMEALPLAENPAFNRYLRSLLDCLDQGTVKAYWQMMGEWVKTRDYPLTFPFTYDEAYMDHLVGIKGGFNAGLFLPDQALSARLRQPLKTLPAFEKTLVFPQPPKVFPELHSAIYQMINHRGMMAEMELRAWNLPNDAGVRERIGARQIIIKESVTGQFRARIFPLVKILFPALAAEIGESELLAGLFLAKVFHELSHNIGYYAVEDKLEKYFWTFEELRAYVLPVLWVHYLERQKIFSPKQKQAVIVMTLLSELIDIALAEAIGTRQSYRQAAVIHFNYLSAHRVVAIAGQKLDLKIPQLESVAKDLFTDTVTLLARGNLQRAQEYVKRYDRRETLAPLMPILRTIVKKHV